MGRITWPISTTTARRLCATARPARYGLKDQTRLDPRVRDTFEIPKTRIRIDQRKWRNTFRPMLDQIRGDLGFPEGARLRAELHNILVYGPGQFFVTHQDSEKGDDMIGTVVVILPSAFTGGAMVVEHHDERLTFRAPDADRPRTPNSDGSRSDTPGCGHIADIETRQAIDTAPGMPDMLLQWQIDVETRANSAETTDAARPYTTNGGLLKQPDKQETP